MSDPVDSAAVPPAPPPVPPSAPVAPSVGKGRHTPDVLTLVVGLMSVAAAVLVLAGWVPQLREFDLRWVLSAGAVVLGVLLLAASARSPRKPG